MARLVPEYIQHNTVAWHLWSRKNSESFDYFSHFYETVRVLVQILFELHYKVDSF